MRDFTWCKQHRPPGREAELVPRHQFEKHRKGSLKRHRTEDLPVVVAAPQQVPVPAVPVPAVPAPAPAHGISNLEMVPTLAKGENSEDFASVLDSLTAMKGTVIWGGSKEIYVNYTAFKQQHQLAQANAGHIDPMAGQWQAAERRAPGFLAKVEAVVNRAVDRSMAHVAEVYGESRKLLLHAPSFLLHGNGGFVHMDARAEYSCLMALVPGPPTDVYTSPFGETNTAIAARALGLTRSEVEASAGFDYVRSLAPLLLPHAELEASMRPVGGVGCMEVGDIGVLPPACIHRTPWKPPGGTADRVMLFFTLAPAPATGRLYDSKAQHMSLDAWAKVVTHNFFPRHLTRHMDCLFACVLAASLNPKFGGKDKKKWSTFVNRIWEYAPPDNMEAAKSLTAAIEKAKLARDGVQQLAWNVCKP